MEKRVGEAVTQQATSWAELLRHITVVRRILGTWPELPAATGDLVCTSQPPLHHHKPRIGQLAQNVKTQMSFCWHLANFRVLWTARKPELPRTKSRRQHATSPYPGTETKAKAANAGSRK